MSELQIQSEIEISQEFNLDSIVYYNKLQYFMLIYMKVLNENLDFITSLDRLQSTKKDDELLPLEQY